MDAKRQKQLEGLCIKLGQVYTDFYILKNGYIVSMDIELPYLIMLSEDQVNLFKECCGEFIVIHFFDIRKFKKSLIQKEGDKDFIDIKTTYEILDQKSKITKVVNMASRYTDDIKKIENWMSFRFSQDSITNDNIVNDLFVKNNSINFLPEDNKNGPEVMITKSLLPSITEKNYSEVCYGSIKKLEDLFCIILHIKLPLFHLYMIHHYIPFGE